MPSRPFMPAFWNAPLNMSMYRLSNENCQVLTRPVLTSTRSSTVKLNVRP